MNAQPDGVRARAHSRRRRSPSKLGTRAANVLTDSAGLAASVLTAAPQRPAARAAAAARCAHPARRNAHHGSTPDRRPRSGTTTAARRDRRAPRVRGSSPRLPALGADASRSADCRARSDATLIAALGRELGSTRFLVVVAEACRRPSDGSPISRRSLDETPVALYPPREGFGEVEPHVEVAGERVETLERVARGEVRVLLTTARAVLERTRLPARRAQLAPRAPSPGDAAPRRARRASRARRLRARPDGRRRRAVHRARRHLRHLQLRHGRPGAPRVLGRRDRDRSATSISPRSAPRAMRRARSSSPSTAAAARTTKARRAAPVAALLPPDTLIVVPVALASRAGAAAHVGRGRASHRPRAPPRRGRAASRRAVPDARRRAAAARRASARIRFCIATRRSGGGAQRRSSFRSVLPMPIDRDIKRLRRLVRDGMPTIILCDNDGQAERLDELLNEDTRRAVAGRAHGRRRSMAASSCRGRATPSRGLRVLTDHEIFRRERRIRRARRYGSRRVAREHHRAQARRLRRASRARRRHLSRHRDDLRRARARSRSRSSSTRAAIGSTSRSIASISSSAIAPPTTSTSDAPPPRLHKLGGKRWAQQRDRRARRIQEMTLELLDLYARRQRRRTTAARSRHHVAAPARVVAFSSRTRPTSARRRSRSRADMEIDASNGPAARRRRRLRQDGDRRARGVQGGAVRAPGRRARADDDSRRPARRAPSASVSPTSP